LIQDERNEPMFVADAVADPLTGLRAAALALESLTHDEGRLVDVSLSDAAALAARISDLRRPLPGALVRRQGQRHYCTASSPHSPLPLVRDGEVPSGFLDD
jgi:crotonobetainyl-CoA:carnitine CoA-transferase CaiB-like acyl-CoA transferase